MTSRDQLFTRFAAGLFVVLLAYGVAMACVFFWGDSAIASRMLSGFVSMFTGILGLGTGYLLGSTSGPVPGGVVSADD